MNELSNGGASGRIHPGSGRRKAPVFPKGRLLKSEESEAVTGARVRLGFAMVRLRQRVTKGAGSRQKGLLMAFKLLAMAERRWRRINGAHLIPLVRAGLLFSDGVRPERRNAA